MKRAPRPSAPPEKTRLRVGRISAPIAHVQRLAPADDAARPGAAPMVLFRWCARGSAPFRAALRRRHEHPVRFSKWCLNATRVRPRLEFVFRSGAQAQHQSMLAGVRFSRWCLNATRVRPRREFVFRYGAQTQHQSMLAGVRFSKWCLNATHLRQWGSSFFELVFQRHTPRLPPPRMQWHDKRRNAFRFFAWARAS